MPSYTDSTGKKLEIEIDLQDAKDLLKVENGHIIYEPIQTSQTNFVIKYSVEYNSQSIEFRFTLHINCPDFYVPEKV
jgi:hypothetical protein